MSASSLTIDSSKQRVPGHRRGRFAASIDGHRYVDMWLAFPGVDDPDGQALGVLAATTVELPGRTPSHLQAPSALPARAREAVKANALVVPLAESNKSSGKCLADHRINLRSSHCASQRTLLALPLQPRSGHAGCSLFLQCRPLEFWPLVRIRSM